MFLVNAAHVKQVPGRKTDKADARWLAKLMRHGLLQASFIPPVAQRDWRDLTRYRTKLVQERSREVNRVQGVLERANIKLASVATDIMGVSARAILAALVEGRADPATMAELAKRRMRSKIPLLEQALTGLVRDHHRQLLALQLAHIDFLDEQIDALSAEITRRLTDLGAAEPPAAPLETAGPAECGGQTRMLAAAADDLRPGGPRAGHDSRGQPAGRGTAGGRVGYRHGALWHRRPPGGLERRGPRQR